MESIKVLVADDNDLSRMIAVNILSRQADFEIVGQADSGVEAITYTYLMSPDLVFLDAGLRGIGAVEVAKWIKKFTPGTKIVLIDHAGPKSNNKREGHEEIDGYISAGNLEHELPALFEQFKNGQSIRILTSGTIVM